MKGFLSQDDTSIRTVREVAAIAKELGVSPAQVALAWLRYRPVPVIPIIGARKFSQFEDNLRSLDIDLSPELVQRLDTASAISLGFPHDLFTMDMVRTFTFGGLRERIKT